MYVKRTGGFPMFILLSTILQISCFCYYYGGSETWKELTSVKVKELMGSPLIFRPKLREEIWRFGTYQFLHAGFFHIFGNMIVQLYIGIPLEMVHGSIRIGNMSHRL